MRTTKADRDVERRRSAREFAQLLRRVASAVERGRAVVVRVGGERVRVPATAAPSVEHEREGGVEELELQLRWRTRRATSAASPKRRG